MNDRGEVIVESIAAGLKGKMRKTVEISTVFLFCCNNFYFQHKFTGSKCDLEAY